MRVRNIITSVLCLFLVAAVSTAAVAKKSKTDYTRHPGYVDFQSLDAFSKEAKIEVNLNHNMIKLISGFLKEEDPDLYDMMINLQLVRIQVFARTSRIEETFTALAAETAELLDNKDWECIVRVSEDNDKIYVYVKPDEDYEWIHGVVVLALEDEEAVFVNIVGDIKPEDVGRIGNHFNVEELDSIRYEIKKGN
jgi:hypothetical protein